MLFVRLQQKYVEKMIVELYRYVVHETSFACVGCLVG